MSPIVWDKVPFTLVGLETVPLDVLGLPRTLSRSEVEDTVRTLSKRSTKAPDTTFVSLVEWARRNDSLDVDVPSYMIKEVAAVRSCAPVLIHRRGEYDDEFPL